MPRPERSGPTGPKLPKVLQDQIGANGIGKKSRNAPTRKDRRKQERQQKKGPRPHQKTAWAMSKQKRVYPQARPNGAKQKFATPVASKAKQTDEVAFDIDDEDLDSEDDDMEQELSEVESDASEELVQEPPPVKLSKTARARLEQDNDEIAALERKLGIKKGKKARAPDGEDDGLDDLLGEIDDAVTGDYKSGKRKLEEDDEWLRQKRRKLESHKQVAQKQVEEEFTRFSNEDEASDADEESDEDLEDDDEENMDGLEDDDDEESIEHLDDESDEEVSTKAPTKRENPYRAPVTDNEPTLAKYIPPSLRKAATTQDESVVRLHRKIQGLVNRLSESNMLSILSSVEALYQDNARGHVTEGLINTLISLVADSDSLSDTFIILHGAFIAGLYRLIGIDLGAQLLERIIHSLDNTSTSPPATELTTTSKKEANLVTLLSTLYTFSIITSTIIYDLIRHYISTLSESHTELLLRIIRTCGSQLRSDDPSSLKDVVSLIQTRTSSAAGPPPSVRQQFMLETITDLKNNRLKSGFGASASRAEMLTRMKKMLGTVKGRASARGGAEPLRVTLRDIREVEKKGKWWLVGASWRDPGKVGGEEEEEGDEGGKEGVMMGIGERREREKGDDAATEMLALARRLGMNTDVRRGVFVAIMAAADFRDAVTRVNKLALKKSQLGEVPRVLVRCVMAEGGWNPYYALVAKELCGAKREVRMGFQFELWDCFKRMGESVSGEQEDEENEDPEGKMQTREVVALAKLFATLVKNEAVPITALKKLDFAYLKPKTGLFLEIMLTAVILDKGKGGDAVEILSKAKEEEGLRLGFRWWIGEVLSKSEVPEKKRHREKVKTVCEAVIQNLAEEGTGVADEEDSE
ncbi:MIF4G domain-containing protein 1 [Elsinoe australis]|uniref:MIF4G domain-containing protein 1 n=1 Tax=Elsinoe australis TaxID=40998 RepID=A0A4U7BAE9_9PEZI|nr:MIF4G domain-containing protein 1 [Elsinoe australis]